MSIDKTTLENALLNVKSDNAEVRKKEMELWKHKVDTNYTDLQERQKQMSILKTIDLDGMSANKVQEAKTETRKYLEHAKNAKVYINNDFKGKIPYFGHNVILVGGRSGTGKSTISANLAYLELLQGGYPLILTNEEVTGDIYNRITCLFKGWTYTEHDSFTKDQLDTFDDMMDKLSSRMTVIDNNYTKEYGQTTTLEGIQSILESLATCNRKYTTIIIDYYTNVNVSLNNPGMENWKVQEKLANYLDQFKSRYLAPIVVLAQLKEGKDLPFKEALEGRKSIYNIATCAIELKAEREELRTAWTIHKSRFTQAIGQTIYTGFDRGKYVPYTSEFKNQIELKKQREEQQSLLKNMFNKKV